MDSYTWSDSTVTGNISSLSGLSYAYIYTGSTYGIEETPEEARKQKKDYIKSIIANDEYLLQEIVTELRNQKINDIKDVTNSKK